MDAKGQRAQHGVRFEIKDVDSSLPYKFGAWTPISTSDLGRWTSTTPDLHTDDPILVLGVALISGFVVKAVQLRGEYGSMSTGKVMLSRS